MLDMTPLGWLGSKIWTQTNKGRKAADNAEISRIGKFKNDIQQVPFVQFSKIFPVLFWNKLL